MKTLGICFGATSMQCVSIEVLDGVVSVVDSQRIIHEGNVRRALSAFLASIDSVDLDRVAVTGREFRKHVNLTSISEPEAVEAALHNAYAPDPSSYPDLVVSLGGETQLVYQLDSQGGISAVHSGSKCASGTGEFFLQQVRRMGLGLDEAISLASKGKPHKVAGRCSVFCKSDCTHALNKGEPVANVVAGLCEMMADKIEELVKTRKRDRIAIIGGGSLNRALESILRTRFPTVDVPSNSAVFEAYGAALWAITNSCRHIPARLENVFAREVSSFGTLPELQSAEHLVKFRELPLSDARPNDECVLGLDVGSTTTKAVLLRRADRHVLASTYLRTNGDPIAASRRCYAEIAGQLGEIFVRVQSVGVTGSGRQIAGLHALTENIINEILAHATAAAFFDSEVDTIFEIGGQDAKYTYLVNGVPSDYAMNEACSAGTGSFLEESARESLNVATEDIGENAMRSMTPPDFSDQCSAFISSDIKRAGQQGIARDDILAGLVYSICMNYLNRVKGARPVGKRIFMQGGVCYNKAVPVAMASLVGAEIIVPPHPGLMGAFGVALAVCEKLDAGGCETGEFDLTELAEREAVREGTFMCKGGREHCDRKCEIVKIRLGDQLHAFGGICDKYYNQRLNKEIDTGPLDYVRLRQRLLFHDFGPVRYGTTVIPVTGRAIRVGLTPSFLTQSLYPLFSNFFSRFGMEVVLPDEVSPEGMSRIESNFCFPAEISHGYFFDLLGKRCDYIFLPQTMQVPVKNVPTYSRMCPFVQGEPYYLKTTFRKEIAESGSTLLSPVLKMQYSYEQALPTFIDLMSELGYAEKDTRNAYLYACARQEAFEKELARQGKQALYYLDRHPDMLGVVLFGRPYNAYVDEANMGIPHKIASRGYMVIPYDMLPAESFDVDEKMFWAMGQRIMKSAQYVKQKANLYGVYITNFSCGPDSFLLGYYRDTMNGKPSLTLELDQHTADAGIDTRIEAALDIMSAHRRNLTGVEIPAIATETQTRVGLRDGKAVVFTEDGQELPITDARVEVLLPSMGEYTTMATAATLRAAGVDARALPVADRDVLQLGKRHTTCKECLPYIVNTGSFINYLRNRKDESKITLLVMATGGGPCRLGQYYRAFERIIIKQGFKNTAMLTITDENGYGGLGSRTLLRAWQSIVASDVMSDISSMLRVTAVDPHQAMEEVGRAWQECMAYFEGRLSIRFSKLLATVSARLARIPLKRDPKTVPAVSLVGEIFVRRDEFSRGSVVDYLESQGFMVRVAPLGEYPLYGNYVVNEGLGERQFTFGERIKMRLTAQIQEWFEAYIKRTMATSGLYTAEMIDVRQTIAGVRHLLNENFRGECILTVGVAMREIIDHSCGVVSIGPFGCMYSRMAEAMLKKEMTVEGHSRMPGANNKAGGLSSLPFLHIETDGTPFPQLVEANLEAFALQTRRVHEKLNRNDAHIGQKKDFTSREQQAAATR